ncbi:MAG: class I SAM-dependent methyltransferase [Candidatus Omnitrophica bacterium]|nr:class I SAM-dependent methyltransferase [Candidatus Omnitrophota bacterium]
MRSIPRTARDEGAPCLACGHPGSAHSTDQALALYRCRACTHMFTGVPAGHLDELYTPAYYLEEHKNWFTHPNTALFQWLYEQMERWAAGRSAALLDVGCGRGDLLKYLRSRDRRLTLVGIDVTANTAPGITFVQGDFLAQRLEQEFDVICGLAVLEHVEQPDRFLEHAAAHLRPGGLLFLMTVNNDGGFYRVARALRRVGFSAAYRRLYSPHHLHHFTNRSLRQLVERYGFRVLAQRNHNTPLSAVDVPAARPLLAGCYRLAVAALFTASAMVRDGILQTVICEKADGRLRPTMQVDMAREGSHVA